MINTELLRRIIADKGLKIVFIASKLKITDASLRNKIENRTSFKLSEVSALCELLGINDLKLKDDIFFADKVEKK